MHSEAPAAQKPTPHPVGVRLLDLSRVHRVGEEAPPLLVLTEDLSSGFRKCVQVEDKRPLVLAEALSCCVIESGEASSAY